MPTSTETYFAVLDLARACMSRRDYSTAGAHIKEAITLDPSRPDAFNLQGALLEIRGDWQKARRYYRAALAFDPAYTPAQVNISRTLPWRWPGEVQLG